MQACLASLRSNFESMPKTDELHKMQYFGFDLPMRSYIDSAVPRNQYRKACPTPLRRGTTAS